MKCNGEGQRGAGQRKWNLSLSRNKRQQHDGKFHDNMVLFNSSVICSAQSKLNFLNLVINYKMIINATEWNLNKMHRHVNVALNFNTWSWCVYQWVNPMRTPTRRFNRRQHYLSPPLSPFTTVKSALDCFPMTNVYRLFQRW